MVDFSDPGSQALSLRCSVVRVGISGVFKNCRARTVQDAWQRASTATQQKATLPRHFLSESANLARCNTSFQRRRKNTNATNSDNKTNTPRRKPIPNSCLIKMVKLEDPATLAISPPSTLTSRAPLSIPALNVEGESGSLSSMID